MNQAELTKLISQLKVAVKPRHRNMKNELGPQGRMEKLRHTVTALIKYERIELFYNRADEARGYTERVKIVKNIVFYSYNDDIIFQLINEAIRYGDTHQPTMEMADYWLLEKQLVHKLFKVICPRFENYQGPVTKMFNAPREYPALPERAYFKRSVLELKGNPYPPILPDISYRNKNLIHNVLLNNARRDFYKENKQEKESKKNDKIESANIDKESKTNDEIESTNIEKVEMLSEEKPKEQSIL